VDKVLILGAGVYQLPLIAAVQRLGFSAVVVSTPGSYPGLDVADEVVLVDTRDIGGVCEAARRTRPCAVVTSGTDVAVPALGGVVDALGLVGVDTETAQRCSNKISMKECLAAAGVPIAPGDVNGPSSDVMETAREIGYPVVVKPPDSSGSRGVVRVDSPEGLAEAVALARSHTSSDQLLVERCLLGTEFGAQAFVVGSELQAVYLHDDVLHETGVHTVPVGHTLPCSLSPTSAELATLVVKEAIVALGVVDAAVNVDLMLVGDQPFVLEVACRAGATCLPELVGLVGGFDVYEELVRLAVTGFADFRLRGNGRAAASGHLVFTSASGVVGQLGFCDPAAASRPAYLESVVLDVSPGDEVHGFATGNHRLGHVLVSASTNAIASAAVRLAAQEVATSIKIGSAHGQRESD